MILKERERERERNNGRKIQLAGIIMESNGVSGCMLVCLVKE